jgi:hypothetical protein
MRENHRLREFENMVLRRILRHKRKVIAEGIILHNEELHNMLPSCYIMRFESEQ